MLQTLKYPYLRAIFAFNSVRKIACGTHPSPGFIRGSGGYDALIKCFSGDFETVRGSSGYQGYIRGFGGCQVVIRDFGEYATHDTKIVCRFPPCETITMTIY